MCNYQQVTIIPKVSTFCKSVSQACTKENYLYKFRLLCCFQLMPETLHMHVQLQFNITNYKGTD